MKKFLIGLFLVFAINAQAGIITNEALLECEYYRKLFKIEKSICPIELQNSSKFLITKKDLNYFLDIRILDERIQIEQEVENALLRYFSIPAYPKEIKEVKELKNADIYILVNLKKYENLNRDKIYYGAIKISFDATAPFSFKRQRIIALGWNFEKELPEIISDTIKEIANEIFQIANDDLSKLSAFDIEKQVGNLGIYLNKAIQSGYSKSQIVNIFRNQYETNLNWEKIDEALKELNPKERNEAIFNMLYKWQDELTVEGTKPKKATKRSGK